VATLVNPYAALLSVRITELFKVVVNAMDETSPSNSSSATTSQKLLDNQLG